MLITLTYETLYLYSEYKDNNHLASKPISPTFIMHTDKSPQPLQPAREAKAIRNLFTKVSEQTILCPQKLPISKLTYSLIFAGICCKARIYIYRPNNRTSSRMCIARHSVITIVSHSRSPCIQTLPGERDDRVIIAYNLLMSTIRL